MVGDLHQTSPPRTKRGAERPPAQTEGASLPSSPDERPPRTFRKTWTASTCVASCSTPEPHGGEGRANSDCSDASGPGGRRRPPQVCDASALRTGIRKRTQRAEPREQGLEAAAGAPHALSLGGTPAQPPGWDADIVCWAFQPTRLLQPFIHFASVSTFISIKAFSRTQISSHCT